jgi:hypothetical protein
MVLIGVSETDLLVSWCGLILRLLGYGFKIHS